MEGKRTYCRCVGMSIHQIRVTKRSHIQCRGFTMRIKVNEEGNTRLSEYRDYKMSNDGDYDVNGSE